MKRFFTSVFAGAVLASLLIAPSASLASSSASAPKESFSSTKTIPGVANKRFVSGWLPYWKGTSTVDTLVANGGEKGVLGEVMPFWLFYKSENASLCVHDMSASVGSCPTKLTGAQIIQRDRLKAAGIGLYPSITDGGEALSLASLLADPAKRTVFVKQLTDFVTMNKFNGVDLDLEGFAFRDGSSSWATTKPHWVAFISELSTSLHAKNKKLSVTVPVGLSTTSDSTGYWVYAWSSILPKVDRLRLMTYDYSFYDYDTANYSYRDPGAMGPYPWLERVAQYVVATHGARLARKVWLGLAAFGYDGRVSTTCDVPSEPRRRTIYPTNAWGIAASLKEQGRLLLLEGQTEPAVKWDTLSRERVFRYSEPDTDKNTGRTCSSVREVWFQDARGHAQRTLLAGKYGLGGVSLWAFGNETPSAWSQFRKVAPKIVRF